MTNLNQPYLNSNGDLVIPFDSDTKYHWWEEGGKGPRETLREMKAPVAMMRRYNDALADKRTRKCIL